MTPAQGVNRWKSHPRAATAVRLAVFVVPVVAAIGASAGLARVLPEPAGTLGLVLWWAALLVGSTMTLFAVDRLARRALPLATLLQLALLFPDAAPSRFRVARKAGRTSELVERVERARREGIEDEPTKAAETILALVTALDLHDRRTRGHSERVRVYSDLLAAELKIPADGREKLRWSALLHDVGKLEVSADILNKPGPPDGDEWERIHQHPEEGARIAGPLLDWLGEWGAAIVQHHERWDGNGYPHGLRGEAISLGARIVGVADCYETITAARPYKKPMPAEAARQEIAKGAGTEFDPKVCRALLNLSIAKLRRSAGVLAWLGQLPFTFGLDRFGQGVVTLAQGAASSAAAIGSVAALVVSGMIPGLEAAPIPSPKPAPRVRAIGVQRTPAPQAEPDAILEPTPAPAPTPTPEPANISAPAPDAPAGTGPEPAPAPQPPPPDATPFPTPPPQPADVLAHGYLGLWSDPDTSSDVLPIYDAAPTRTTLPDVDGDGDPGLTLRKSGDWEDRHQIWFARADSRVRLSGAASLTFWSALRNFATGQKGRVDAAVHDCNEEFHCVEIAQGSVARDVWASGQQTWVERTIPFGDVDHTLEAGRYFVLVLTPHESTATPSMWFAFATKDSPAALRFTLEP